jgi:hypothetical protein
MILQELTQAMVMHITCMKKLMVVVGVPVLNDNETQKKLQTAGKQQERLCRKLRFLI